MPRGGWGLQPSANGDPWQLHFPRPPVDRMEYLVELLYAAIPASSADPHWVQLAKAALRDELDVEPRIDQLGEAFILQCGQPQRQQQAVTGGERLVVEVDRRDERRRLLGRACVWHSREV